MIRDQEPMSDEAQADALVAPESERCVLGGLMLAPERFDDVKTLLCDEAFQDTRHRILWKAVLALVPGVCDYASIRMELEHLGKFEAVGGNEFLLDVSSSVTTTAHLLYHARILERATRLRRLRSRMRQLASECDQVRLTSTDDSETLISDAQIAVTEAAVPRDDVATSEPASAPARRVVDVWSNPHAVRGMPTGIGRIDGVLGGMEEGNMVVIAGRPSRGKTALAVQATLNAGARGDEALFITMEMTREQISARMVANLAGVELRRGNAGKLDQRELMEARFAAEATLSTLPITLVTPRKRDYRVLRSIIRRHRSAKLVVVDYLQLLRGEERDRFQQVGGASTECKNLAMEFGNVMLVLSQLDRAAEKERPQMAHLRESGNIEQDANQIILACFQSEPNAMPDPRIARCELALNVVKNRDGRTDEAVVDWDRSTGRIEGDMTLADGLFS